MKELMGSCTILALPDFSKPFILECDAIGDGIGAVLKKGKHPISLESRKLQPHENFYSISDKEMLSIMHALIELNNT